MIASMDQSLQVVATCGPEFGTGQINHAPMVLAALGHLGVDEGLDAWARVYVNRLEPWPASSFDGDFSFRFAQSPWSVQLGRYETLGAWRSYFAERLRTRPWRTVLAEWVPRLAPAASCAEGHGIIRTGHAARSLAAKDTGERRDELAAALAYWAARYRPLPERRAIYQALSPIQVVRSLHPVPGPSSSISVAARLMEIEDHCELGSAGSAIVVNSPYVAIGQIIEAFTDILLRDTNDHVQTLVFVHTVTMPGAARMLLRYLDERDQRALVRYVFQACVAMYLGYGLSPTPLTPVSPTGGKALAAPAAGHELGRETLIAQALACRDEHAIEFVDACLTEEVQTPVITFRDAAARVIHQLG